MEDILNDLVIALGGILTAVAIYFLSPLILALTFSKILMKGLTVSLVFWFTGISTDFMIDMIKEYTPQGSIVAYSCQLGVWEGLNLFIRIVMTYWASTWIILALIGG